MTKAWCRRVGLILGVLGSAGSARAYGDTLTGMPRELEITYALSALPPHLRDGATGIVLVEEIARLEEDDVFGAPRPQPGARVYLNVGPVTLQVVAVPNPHPAAKALYFAVADLDAVHARAEDLGCLAAGDVHGTPAGQPVGRRPGAPRGGL